MLFLLFLMGISKGDTLSIWAYNWGFTRYYYLTKALCKLVDTSVGVAILTEEQPFDTNVLRYVSNYGEISYAVLNNDTVFIYNYMSGEKGMLMIFNWGMKENEVLDSTTNTYPVDFDVYFDGTNWWVVVGNKEGTDAGVYWTKNFSGWKFKPGLKSTFIKKVCFTLLKDNTLNVVACVKSGSREYLQYKNIMSPFMGWATVDTTNLDPDSIRITALCGDTADPAIVYVGDGNKVKSVNILSGECVNVCELSSDVKKLYLKNGTCLFIISSDGKLYRYKNGSLEESPISFAVRDISVIDGVIYIATDKGVMHSADFVNWESMNEGFSDWGFVAYATDVYAISGFDDKMFCYTKNGMSYFEDNRWKEGNAGLGFHTYISDEVIDSIYSAFKVIRSYYDSVIGVPFPDVDNDGLVWIYLMDVSEFHPGGEEYVSLPSYYDSINEKERDTLLAPYSNHADIVYIDCYPQDLLTQSRGALADGLYLILQREADPDEEAWVRWGCEEFFKYRFGLRGNSMLIESENSLIDVLYGNSSQWFNERSYTFGFIGFLWEKYANCDDRFIGDLVKEPYNGIEGVINCLNKYGINRSFEELFKEFILTCFFDAMGGSSEYYSDKFNYSIVNTKERWEEKVSLSSLVRTSYICYEQIRAPVGGVNESNFKGVLCFNGEDAGNFAVYVSQEEREWDALPSLDAIKRFEEMDLDDKNVGKVLLNVWDSLASAGLGAVRILLINKESKIPERYYGMVCDTNPPEVSLSAFQNPFYPTLISAYITVKHEGLYKDAGEEKGIVEVNWEDTIKHCDTVELSLWMETDSGKIYKGDYAIPKEGEYHLVVKSKDIGMVYADFDTVKVKFVSVLSGEKKEVELGNLKLTLKMNISGNVFLSMMSKDGYMPFVEGVKEGLSDIYVIGNGNQKGEFVIRIKSDKEGVICRYESGVWESLPTVRDGEYLTAFSEKGGIYQIRLGSSIKYGLICVPVPARNNLCVYYNAIGKEKVSIKLYDALGRVVRNIFDGYLTGKGLWDVNVSDLSSGVYFVKVLSSRGEIEEKVIIMK